MPGPVGNPVADPAVPRPAAPIGQAEPARSRHLRIIAGHEIYFDAEGFFWEPADWTPDVAAELGRESGIDQLDETQWRVLRFFRDYYERNGRTPMNRELRIGTGLSLMELERLFPAGIRMGARRLAGLPNPATCLD